MVNHKTIVKTDSSLGTDNKNSFSITDRAAKAINSYSHVHCLDTGEIFEVQLNVSNSLIEQAINQVERETGIEIVEYRFDLIGYQHYGTRQ